MAPENQENAKGLKRALNWLRYLLSEKIVKEANRIRQEDPRRVVHSLKVGLAITAVSLFYYFDFFFDGFGVSAMWAIMTVVVIFEFSVGATLGKGINRGIATLLGGALGIAIHRLASFTGEKIESIILGMSCFLIAPVVTFIRFFPKMKARYDYGLLIFILTFSLITVSGYRDDEVLDMAEKRLTTVLVGGFVAIFVCIVICPIWAGEDLHKLTSTNIEKLGIFLEGFEYEYFQVQNEKNRESSALMNEYKTVLSSKGIEDSLANFARWEPRHGKFKYRHPWDEYLKIGSLTRECAYKIDALNTYLNSNIKTPIEARAKIQELCTKMSSGCSNALRELSIGIDTMTNCALFVDPHIANATSAATNLKSSLKTSPWTDVDMLGIFPLVTVTSLLMEIVVCTAKIVDSVHELALSLKFKSPDAKMARQTSPERVARSLSIESHIIQTVE